MDMIEGCHDPQYACQKTTLYYLFWEMVFMVFVADALVILYGLLGERVRGSSSSSSLNTSLKTKFFILTLSHFLYMVSQLG